MTQGRRDTYTGKDKDCENPLTADKVSLIKQRLNDGEAISSIALDTGVKYCIIYNIRKEYAWKYVEPAITLPQSQTLKGKMAKTADIPTTCQDMSPSVLRGWGFVTK